MAKNAKQKNLQAVSSKRKPIPVALKLKNFQKMLDENTLMELQRKF